MVDEKEGVQIGKKTKVALLVGYIGTNFLGSQIQKDGRTVESDLQQALYRCGCIRKENLEKLSKIGWSRASRTDKGVHAARQVFGAKLLDRPKLLECLNEELPQDIRCFEVTKVTRAFNARTFALGRRYEYLLPLFCLDDRENSTFDTAYSEEEKERISERFSNISRRFQGSHKFHNYTSGKVDVNATSFSRVIHYFRISEVRQVDGICCALIEICGNSFMFHQIRKMIGAVCVIFRGWHDITAMEDSFRQHNAHMAIFPGVGLILENIDYSGYIKRFKKTAMSFDESAPLVQSFKEVIYSHIVQRWKDEKVWEEWFPGFFRNRETWFGDVVDNPWPRERKPKGEDDKEEGQEKSEGEEALSE